MDWVLIFLEYVLYTVPIFVGLIFSLRWFVLKKTYERLIYVIAFFLPIVSLLSLIKVFYILELAPTEKAFVITNTVFAVCFIIFTAVVISLTVGKLFAKPGIFEIIGIVFLVLSSIILKDKIKILDYCVWGIIGITTVHLSRGFVYSKYGSTRERRAYVILVIAVSSSILLKLLYYINLIPLRPTIYISLALMLLALLCTVFVWHAVGSHMPQRDIKEEVYKSKFSTFKKVVFLTVITFLIVSMSGILGYNEYRIEKENIISNAIAETREATYEISNKLSDILTEEFRNHIQYLASTLNFNDLSKVEEGLRTFYETHNYLFSSVTLMNTKGIILYTYPFTYSIGADISAQEHVKKVLETHLPTLSKPFMAVEGFPAVALHIPIFVDGKFTYTLAGLIDSRTLTDLIEKPLLLPADFIIAEDNIVMSTNIDLQYFLKDLDTVIANYSEDKFIIQKTSFAYMEHTFKIIGIENASTVQKSILGIVGRVAISYGMFTLLILVLFGSMLLSFFLEERELTGELEKSILKELENLKAYRETQTRLTILNEFIYTVDIEAPEESTLKNFLNVVLELIPKIDKGVLWFATDGEVVPVASFGYNEELIKKLRIEKSREERLWSAPTIIENIGVSELPKELQEVGTQLGLDEIKETLITPIYVSRHYAGHLSLDILKEGMHFTEESRRLANSISKVISFYLSTRGTLSALKKEVDVNASLAYDLENLATFISKANFKESENEFFNGLLSLTLSLIGGEKGSVLLRKGNITEYISTIGYDKEVLNEIMSITAANEERIIGEESEKIVKHVGLLEVKEEFKGKALALGLDKLTYTITASFFVDGEYSGGIFIDTTKEPSPFSKKDVEIMKSVSNLGSLYLRTKKLFKELEDELKIDDLVEKIMELTSTELTEAFLKESFRTIIEVFHYARYIKGTLRIEDKFANFYVDKDTAFFEFSSDRISQRIEEFKKQIQSEVAVVNYEAGEDAIEIGVINTQPETNKIITQLDEGIIAPIKNFFLSKDRAKLFADLMIAFARAIDSKDPYTRTHSENVTKYAYLLGKHVSLNKNDLKTLVFAGILHDIGKIGVKDEILLKNEPLTEDERKAVRVHPEKGYEIISPIEGLTYAAKVLRHHHERCDGFGYPDKLKGEEIPYLSRILAICDAFDAMTTDRPYRKAMDIDKALKEILKNKGTQFDPELATEFSKLKDTLPKVKEVKIEEIIQEVLRIK